MSFQNIKKILPWWVKIGAKIVCSRLPARYDFWQKIGLFRHGYMDVHEYSLNIFNEHMAKSGFSANLAEKTIVELGPGDSIATAILAKAHGARSILVDVGRYAVEDLNFYRDFVRILSDRGHPFPSLENVTSFSQILDLCEARYLTQGLSSLHAIDDQSVDLVFSQAVLEHVRKHEFLEIQRQVARVLKPGGVCSHRVDLRDHLGGALNNLRFSEKLWESRFFADSGFYTNRLQMKNMLELFESAGFEVDVVDIRRWQALPTPRAKMDALFADLPEECLNIAGFDVLLRKPYANAS